MAASANNIKTFICSSELFSSYELKIDVSAIVGLIRYYTREAGVRSLKRKIIRILFINRYF